MAISDEKPEDHQRPLSSTDMFLRSFDSPESAPDKPAENGGAGDGFWPAYPPQSASSRPSTPIEASPAADMSGATGGEFTRLFVRPTPSGEHERLTPLPNTAPSPTVAARMTRAAVPEGASFGPASGSPPNVQPSSSSTPAARPSQFFSREVIRTPAPQAERTDFFPEPGYGRGEQPPAYSAGTPSGSSEVNELRRSLSDEQYPYPEQPRNDRQWGQDPFRETPPQQFSRPAQEYGGAPSPPSSSVTVMLDRLALEEARASFSQTSPQTQPVLPPERPAPYVSQPSGPGEYTRVINRIEMGSSSPQAVDPPATVPTVQSSAPLAMPQVRPMTVTPPAIPMTAAAIPVAAPARPKPPKVPALAAPVLAAPKSKLQEMLPLLLIANAFLMILLIVVVVFALRARS